MPCDRCGRPHVNGLCRGCAATKRREDEQEYQASVSAALDELGDDAERDGDE